jgi:hypothetical protein
VFFGGRGLLSSGRWQRLAVARGAMRELPLLVYARLFDLEYRAFFAEVPDRGPAEFREV